MEEKELQDLLCFVKRRFAGDFSGHDYAHTFRVYRLALALWEKEGGDEDLIVVAALLHDVDDHKLFDPAEQAARTFLTEHGYEPAFIEKVLKIIEDVSYKGTDSVTPSTLEGKIVQDADRLDAIGAIGIARTFEFGGSHHRVTYDPDVKPRLGMNQEETYLHVGTTLNHFYEKLLLLENLMNTPTAKEMAKARTHFMREYLDEFLAEWEQRR